NAFYRHSRIKQYLKDARALRIETVINDPEDLSCRRCTISTNCRPAPVRSTPPCWILNVSARVVSLRVQPLSGSRGPPSPRRAGGPRPYGSATLGSRPWPARCAPACSPSPASPTRACARLDDRLARRCELLDESGQLRPGPATGQRPHRPHPGQEPLPPYRRRAAVRDFLHQTARPAATPAARRRPTTGTNAGTKSLANHRDSHHRNHRPGSPTAKSSLKLKTTLKDLATKVHYAAAGTLPGGGGPSGSFNSRGQMVS